VTEETDAIIEDMAEAWVAKRWRASFEQDCHRLVNAAAPQAERIERADAALARQLRESIKRNGKLTSDMTVLALELNRIRVHTMKSYQLRVRNWVMTCFGSTVADDVIERNYRFLEEALELVQSLGCTREDALNLVDYVYGRPVGEPAQEVGGVEVTLNALCSAAGIDAADAAETELARIWGKIEAIREKQRQKPRFVSRP
jgi:hypothetical protein